MLVADKLADRIFELQSPLKFVKDLGVYIFRNGRKLAESRLHSISENYISSGLSRNLGKLTDRMLAGKLSLADWQSRMAASLKDGHITNMLIGRGGKNAATFADYGRVGGVIRSEYRALSQFAEQIKNGELSEAQIKARIQLYANSVQRSYWSGRTAAMSDAAYDIERRVLHPAEHCDDCIGYADMGWVPIGSLPEPGSASRCGSNCKCTKEFGKSAEQQMMPEAETQG